MIVQKAFKFRLSPTKQQFEQLRRFVGCTRFVWNHFLNLQEESLQTTRRTKSYSELCKLLTMLKRDPERSWLNDAPSQSLQQVLKHLCEAYGRYFKKLSDRPRFKKKGRRDSFRIPADFKINGATIQLPKMGETAFYKSRDIVGQLRNVTVSKRGKHWYLSIQTQLEVADPIHPSTSMVGIDVGISKFVALSDGTAIAPLHSFRSLAPKLVKEQRKLARKVKGSNNFKKQKEKVVQIHIKIADARQDFLHKNSTTLSKNHAKIVMEDLQISNMSKSAKGTQENPGINVSAKSGLNKSILDQSWYEFRRQLQYKQLWGGGTVILVPPQHTSQRCSSCGHTDALNRLSQAKFLCVQCRHSDNADINAAKNILAAGHAVVACGDIR